MRLHDLLSSREIAGLNRFPKARCQVVIGKNFEHVPWCGVTTPNIAGRGRLAFVARLIVDPVWLRRCCQANRN
jgi:hypothetical protein